MYKLPDVNLLKECISQSLRGKGPIGAVKYERSPYSSWYATYIVQMELVGGQRSRLFLKDYDSYLARKSGMRERRECELHVYRDILPDQQFGTARYHGALWDDSRHWLLIEFVDGIPVRECGFDFWVSAASWLGRFHGYFAQQFDSLKLRQKLRQYDETFFRQALYRAVDTLSRETPDLLPRVTFLRDNYDGFIAIMMKCPSTLLHGAYKSQQILVDSRITPARICPVDWELAGVGPCLYDLACFADGFKGNQLDQIITAYAGAAAKAGLGVPTLKTLNDMLACFQLHRLVNWLGQRDTHTRSPNDVEELVSAAEYRAQRLLEAS